MTPNGATTMTRYFVEYPRGFANEYTVYAAPSGFAGTFGELFPAALPITRAEAIRLGWTRPREAKRDGEQWFGGFAETRDYYSSTLDLALADCLVATLAVASVAIDAGVGSC